MIYPERPSARELDRQLRARLDPLVEQLTIAGRLELLAYVAATIAADATHELRAMFAEPVPIERGGEREEARKPLPAHTVTPALPAPTTTEEIHDHGTD